MKETSIKFKMVRRNEHLWKIDGFRIEKQPIQSCWWVRNEDGTVVHISYNFVECVEFIIFQLVD